MSNIQAESTARSQIDFIAAGACPERSRRIIPADAWYILPIAAIHGRPDILLPPTARNPNTRATRRPGTCCSG